MPKPSLCIAHSGGVTAILNTTAAASIAEARKTQAFSKIYAAEYGLNGLINGRLYDTDSLSDADLLRLRQTPSSAFGSCRYKLRSYVDDPETYAAIFKTCAQANIQFLLYQGGNDSQDTTLKLSEAQSHFVHPLSVIGLPKTIDNDLHGTDFCPGYPSAAKYIATSVSEAALDTRAMSRNSTQVFILEVMGRHTGWLAMAGGIGRQNPEQAPHCILVPEKPFHKQSWLDYVQYCVSKFGFCVVVAAEGIVDTQGQRLATGHTQDAFGHVQLGGVGATLAGYVLKSLGLKTHWALPDYLQRSAGHLRAQVDVACADQLGRAGVQQLLAGRENCMLGLKRHQADPYQFTTVPIDLRTCANHEKPLPDAFISTEHYLLSAAARSYLTPLITGESLPIFLDGRPDYFNAEHLQFAQLSPIT